MQYPRWVGIALLLSLTPRSVLTAAEDHDWPQFRGARVDGKASARGILSGARKPSLTMRWRRELGGGYSGVSVAGGLAVTMFTDGKENILIALDAETGRERWSFPLSPVYRGHDGSFDGPISTPLIEGTLTVALGPKGRLLAVDNLDGELVWSIDLVEDLGVVAPYYGFATSPLAIDGHVLVQLGGEAGTVAAFDPATGEREWTVGADAVNYQTPILWARDGTSQLIASGNDMLFAVDPSSGTLLWKHAHGGSGAVGSWAMVPVAAGSDRLFLNSTDHSSTAIRLHGDDQPPTPLWEARTIRNTYSVGVYHEGHLYGFSSRFLTCVNAETGEAAWKSRAPGDGFLILVDDHLVLLTKDGSLHLAKGSPKGYQELASTQVFEDLAWTPPAFARGSVFARSMGAIARIDLGRNTLSTDNVVSEGENVSTSRFARFLAELRDSKNKNETLDAFFEEHRSFPVVEGDRDVHFVFRGEADDMAIGGDMIGGRQEKPMHRVEGTDFFYYSTELRPDARVSYVFIKDFDHVLPDPLNPWELEMALIGEDMGVDMAGGNGREPMPVSSLAMPKWERPRHLAPRAATARRGRMERHELESAALNRAHEIDVYLPYGYGQTDERYPVLYYHGGTNARMLGGLENTLDALTGTEIAPVIVVFIDAIGGHLFMPRDRYGEMWANELVPFIDETYRTIRDRTGRANAGAGITSHDAAHCAFRYPSLSSKLAIQSLGVIDIGRSRLEALVTSASEHPLDVHIEWGVYDLYNPHEDMDMGGETRSFVDFLRGRGYDVEAVEVPDGTGWPAWRQRSHAVLESLFPLD